MERLGYEPHLPLPAKRRWLPVWATVTGATLAVLLIAAAVVVGLVVLLLWLAVKALEFIAPML